jgi:nucleotide-binding universal stress UspA family protein
MKIYVVGTDGSETAARAAKRAGELAHAAGAAVHVVSAFSRGGSGTTIGGIGSDQFVVSSLSSAESVADQQAATFRAQGVEATSAALDQKPAEALINEAERLEAELIVVGNRRMQGVSRLLGSVANEVAHNAPCDVLIVKTV